MITYKEGYKYQLQAAHLIQLPIEFNDIDHTGAFLKLSKGCLSILNGYAWDGPSGPTVDTKSFMRGSLVHDALYQLIREGVVPRELRKEADKVLRDICLADGMSKVRAWYVYKCVRAFGKKAAISKKDIKVAP